ncbi:MAG: LLM class flavin-dependent oxidoreductase [Acidimicrobiales bacterium]|jgi:alkanesulfonate monooxygenase SsuD/methylene tetrahydromethanopterin reductase-like flavin-dependent oxidoreductase (luciferase family)|nr:LLM class flavin-dependent oxidoreductase [Acidimicrobiales bacterium]
MTSSLNFGIFDQLENDGATQISSQYRDHLELARIADEGGFTHWFKSEHHSVPLDIAPSINVFLSAVIQATQRIRISSLVHLFPFYDPMRLYEELCMLDHLSEGRLDIGFGKGVSPPEQILWGVPGDEALDRTNEVLNFVLSAMRLATVEGLGCLFNFEGSYWSTSDHPLEIGPFQEPHPPLWRPGNPSTAAQMGVSTIIPGPTALLPERVEAFRTEQTSEVAGGYLPIISTLRRVVIATTHEEALRIAERAWRHFDANLTKLFRKYDLWPPTIVPSFLGDVEMALATESLIVGNPQQVKEYFIQMEEESMLEHVTISPAFGNLSSREARATLEAFVEHVIEG